jgi:hypothetical protein
MSDTVPVFQDVFDGSLFSTTAVRTGPAGLDEVGFADVFASAGAPAGPGAPLGARAPRFDGDVGQLPAEACWALQELVAAPHVTLRSKKHWAAVLTHEEVLRERLSELGLVLEINREHGYAFTRQGGDPSPHARTILRARTLSLAASTLALYLYNQYVTAVGDPVVETGDMLDHMLGYKRQEDTNEAQFERAVRAAIKQLEDAAIIRPVGGTTRYLIYGVITSILSADRVDALGARYKALSASGADGAEESEDQDEDEPETLEDEDV